MIRGIKNINTRMITHYTIFVLIIMVSSCSNTGKNNLEENTYQNKSESRPESPFHGIKIETKFHKILCYGSFNDSTDTKQVLDSVVILNSTSGKTVQKIALGYTVDPGGQYDVLKIMDMNFDKHPDLLVLGGEAPYFGPAYNIYLFNSKTDNFEEPGAEETAGVGFNPEVDSVNKTITVYIKNGPVLRRMEVYRWQDDKFVLVEDFDQESVGENEEEIKTTYRKLVNGKMKVVKVTKE